jgi:hypothetical protein
MAIPAALSASYHDWQIDYRAILREYGTGFVKFKLEDAITECMARLVEIPLSGSDFLEHRSCIIALSDLFVLRTLDYKYEAKRMVAGAQSRQRLDPAPAHTARSPVLTFKELSSIHAKWIRWRKISLLCETALTK